MNTALKDTAFIMRDVDGMCRPIFHTLKNMEICDECANTLCDVTNALRQGKDVVIK